MRKAGRVYFLGCVGPAAAPLAAQQRADFSILRVTPFPEPLDSSGNIVTNTIVNSSKSFMLELAHGNRLAPSQDFDARVTLIAPESPRPARSRVSQFVLATPAPFRMEFQSTRAPANWLAPAQLVLEPDAPAAGPAVANAVSLTPGGGIVCGRLG